MFHIYIDECHSVNVTTEPSKDLQEYLEFGGGVRVDIDFDGPFQGTIKISTEDAGVIAEIGEDTVIRYTPPQESEE